MTPYHCYLEVGRWVALVDATQRAVDSRGNYVVVGPQVRSKSNKFIGIILGDLTIWTVNFLSQHREPNTYYPNQVDYDPPERLDPGQ